MRLLRASGNILLWVLAAVGALSAGLWAANAAGWLQPLVVVSGSMEPEIGTGDLLIAIPVPVGDLEVGDVASIPSERSGNLVTHRVVEIESVGAGREIRMQGDANDIIDAETYVIAADETVLTPAMRIPGGGYVVTQLAKPGVALPLLVAIAALMVLAILPSGRRGERTVTADAVQERAS